MTLNNAINAPYQILKTWTPTISGTTSSGVGTYTLQKGFWNQIGDIIFVTLDITWTAHTGTGDMLVSNFPFACHNTTDFNPEFIVNVENILLPATTVSVYGHLMEGTTNLILTTIRSLGTNDPIAMSASGTVHATGWYVK